MATVQSAPNAPVGRMQPSPMTREEKKVIFASSLGTVFEWYDFYLYGSLAAIIAKQFFSGLDPTAAFIFALLAFAAGFLVRPFGALVFGRLGDMIGRKYTFLITILIMGTSTFIVGLLPSYTTIGAAAPVILIMLRLLQGLALGGEYGGAATYVAEHAPHGRRGNYTSWIQTTATLGLFLSLIVILVVRELTGASFEDWGWRIPFLVSIVLLATSVYIRLSMSESPAFQKMKAEGKTSKAPLTESFGQWRNLKIVILALVGLTAGQAVVWYTGQFYALFFLTQVLKVDAFTANVLIAVALAIGTPFFVFFGSLSDRIGRKWIIMAGCLLAVLTYFPLFKALTHYANPALERAQQTAQITIKADPKECSFQGSPIAREVDFRSSCDIAKRTLAQSSASYESEDAPAGTIASVTIAGREIASLNASRTADGQNFDADSKKKITDFKKSVSDALKAANYPSKADPAQMNTVMVLVILVILVIYVTMVYGPIAAMLVELFPTRIRYTSMSLPYHIGNGWFGGLLPTISFALVAQHGNIYYGLWYPIWIAAITFVIGALFVRETKDVDIYRHD
ncbi:MULTISPECIES: MFS transporter [Ralstonia solanacearum species complex]|uniref:MFS transporter n=4 Tax=Ralstonia solanacearum species complex TaxID=3116862 RepID=A0A0K1ZN41_RALSL|nr:MULTISPECIES: MFS transporter [Ralstonia]AKZ27520.1 major facilitator transporter [Ralstonia solanacearum]APC67646.2 MFS transporter [Ralstonia solanacearum OE1-1]APF88126.1 MFS transporter [Ralstonia solanacearum FJAT-1458]ARS55145.1 MFS transporter [Ralstonia solanacearum FJAT-91]ESS49369.1 sugar transporter transmembrane protein [Ralstonia solanacearum SD54]